MVKLSKLTSVNSERTQLLYVLEIVVIKLADGEIKIWKKVAILFELWKLKKFEKLLIEKFKESQASKFCFVKIVIQKDGHLIYGFK